MLKLKLLTVTFLFGFMSAFAQEGIVKKIRQEYINYNKQVTDAEGIDFHPPSFKISNVQNRPALGPVNINITYYYDEHSNLEEEEDNSNIKNWAILRKVLYTEGMPSYTDYKEMFFNAKGELLFYYVKSTGYDCSEKRFYFNKGKLIKIKFNPITHEQCSNDEEFPTFTRYAGKLTKVDLDWEKWIVKKAQKHKKVLINLFESTQ